MNKSLDARQRSNFTHLNLEQAWFGLLNGTTLTFLAIFGARLGASTQQVGFIVAFPALANLLFTLPGGAWVERVRTTHAVFWSAVLQRIFYAVLIFLPFFFPPQTQIWVIIVIMFVMSVPGTILVVGTNTLIAETVPVEWRANIAGRRNSMFSVVSIVTILLSGQILNRMPFPSGYQVVFALGVVGALMSTVHLSLIRSERLPRPAMPMPAPPQAAGESAPLLQTLSASIKGLRLDVLAGHFGKILLLIFILHTFQMSLSAIFPIYVVEHLHLTDQVISIGSSLTYTVFFISSTQLVRVARRMGNRKITAIGIMILSTYPLGLILVHSNLFYWCVTSVGGLGWSFVAGGILNYLLDNIPPDQVALHLSWYNLAFNAAFLIGAIVCPAFGDLVGLVPALIIFGMGRILAGVLILLWG